MIGLIGIRLSSTVDSQDVAEAMRLVREALLSYAIDPLTGKIDMDLINTGKSGAIREKVDQIKNIVLDILNKKSHTAEYTSLLADVKSAAGMVHFIFHLHLLDCR